MKDQLYVHMEFNGIIPLKDYLELKRIVANYKARERYKKNTTVFKERHAKYKKENREKWNEYQNNYKKKRYLDDLVYREKEKEKKRILYQQKKSC